MQQLFVTWEEISFPQIKGVCYAERLLESLRSPWKVVGELSLKSPGQLQRQLREGSTRVASGLECGYMRYGVRGTNFLFGHSDFAKRRQGPCCLFSKFSESRELCGESGSPVGEGLRVEATSDSSPCNWSFHHRSLVTCLLNFCIPELNDRGLAPIDSLRGPMGSCCSNESRRKCGLCESGFKHDVLLTQSHSKM